MRNLFKKVRIDRLYFGSFAVFITLLLLIFTWVSYSVTSRELASVTSSYQQELLNELNKQLDIQLKSIEQVSLTAALNIDRIGFDPLEKDPFELLRRRKDLLKMLSNISYSTTMIQSIYFYMDHPILTDAQGPVQFGDILQAKQEAWYSEVQNNDFAWIAKHTIQTNSGAVPVISFARKLYSNSGKYYGLLMLNVKGAEMESLIRGETDGRNRVLLDAGGKTIMSIGQPVLNEVEIGKSKTSINKSETIHLPEGEEALMVWSNSHSDWMLVEVTPWKNIVHGSVRLALILLSVGLSAIVIAAFITFLLSRQFTQPIRLLLSAMGGIPSHVRRMDLPQDYQNEFGSLFNGYRKQMERIEELLHSLKAQHKRQREAEIQALQAMINPHFLYNTLDQLNWLAIDSGQEKISKILSLMGKMFRIGLSNGETMITIPDEITHIECYLQIQNIRWGERLSFSIAIDDELKGLYIPRLTLQPFVENAIIHGFARRKSGEIRITGRLREQEVEFQICDNGVGLRRDWDKQKPRKTGGYGIRNVKERIEAYFGEPYGVQMSSSEGEGTRVTILVPKIENQQEVGERFHVENPNY
ncbi:cache domain-containing sensor histidine kinase [Paenibacillus cremeus]|uniref:Sensor histidine kinase n=1 Tax=Paenibacillus cremeus TaxID=2163881 RepID=A0A559KDU6_9BACL|nr:sensor histidine kinase [Paenibacillus cremeus]TVY10283.1 sensor histidine kinase [Paenibacillus cremeus]